MRWVKRGLIYAPDGYAALPIVEKVGDDTLRIYYSARDEQGRSYPSFIEVDADDPQCILYVHDRPILSLGKPGMFDCDGVMASWIVGKCLYYIGWNAGKTVPYHNWIGLAIGDRTAFHKYAEGPIIGQGIYEPLFATAPCVLKEGRSWKMWYSSCTKWVGGEPFYCIKYAESRDGAHWILGRETCIGYDDFADAFARPCVLKDAKQGVYKMFYSYRSAEGYRTDKDKSYRLGYAESEDGFTWERKDDLVGIERSDSGWDSEMIEYCYVYKHREDTYMVYNGNGFGRSGFGYAILERE